MFRSGGLWGPWQNLQVAPLEDHYPVVEAFIFSLFTDSVMFASWICWYFIETFLPSISEMFAVQVAATQAQSMIDPSLWLPFGEVFFSKNSAQFYLQTYLCSLGPNSSILTSSEVQSASGVFRCSFANFWRQILWWGCDVKRFSSDDSSMRVIFVTRYTVE